jgi:hypothetical protein
MQKLDSAKLIVQRTRSMRASEAPRVLKRMAAAVRKYPDVIDGQLIFCDQSRNRSYRKRRKSRTTTDVRFVEATIYAAEAIEQVWIGSARSLPRKHARALSIVQKLRFTRLHTFSQRGTPVVQLRLPRSESNDVRDSSDIVSPCVHKLTPLFERAAAPISLLNFVAHLVSQCHFGDVALVGRFVACPVTETRAAPVRRHRWVNRLESVEHGIHAQRLLPVSRPLACKNICIRGSALGDHGLQNRNSAVGERNFET